MIKVDPKAIEFCWIFDSSCGLVFKSEVNYGSCPFLSVFTAEARNCGGARRSVVAFVNSVWSPKGDTLDVLDVGPVVEVVALYLTFTCVLVFCHSL